MPANDRRLRFLLAAIVACGFVLRGWGMWFGLPLRSNLYIRPDESLIVAAAARFWDTGGDPGFFAYPALMVEICAILYLPWKVFGDGISSAFARDPSVFFFIARSVSVAAGTASIVLVYRVTRSVATPTAGIIAAALFSFSTLAARDAHFGVTDTLLVFLLLATMAWPVKPGRLRDVIIVGAIYGLACSTKYTAILLAPAVALRLSLDRNPTIKLATRDIATAGISCVLVFVLLNPYIFLFENQSRGQVSELFEMFYRSQPGDLPWNPADAVMQVVRPLRYGPGGHIGFMLAALALVFARRRMALLPCAIAAATLCGALLPFHHTAPYRYALPILPFLAILAAITLDGIKSPLWKAALAFLVIAPGAWDAARLATILHQTDARTLAATWISENVSTETPVLILGPPECEPQLVETSASIKRRIGYVHHLYGPVSGGIVSVPYNMMLAAAPAGTPGREVFRNVPPDQVPGPELLVVIPFSPLALVAAAVPGTALPNGAVTKSTTIESLSTFTGVEFDAIDAFFVPFRPLNEVMRPGPSLRLILIRR